MRLLTDRKLSDGRYHVVYEAGDGKEVEILVETNALYPYMKASNAWINVAVSVVIACVVVALCLI